MGAWHSAFQLVEMQNKDHGLSRRRKDWCLALVRTLDESPWCRSWHPDRPRWHFARSDCSMSEGLEDLVGEGAWLGTRMLQKVDELGSRQLQFSTIFILDSRVAAQTPEPFAFYSSSRKRPDASHSWRFFNGRTWIAAVESCVAWLARLVAVVFWFRPVPGNDPVVRGLWQLST